MRFFLTFDLLCSIVIEPDDPTSRFQLRIRPAETSDAAAVASIYNHAIEERIATFETEPRSDETMRDWIRGHDDRHPFLVAVSWDLEDNDGSGKVVGWTSVSSYRSRACYAGVGEISVYVREGHRGKGVGKALLLSLIEETRSLGYWKLLSRIFPFNSPSRALCQSCGFREVGIYEKHGKLDGRWLDTVIVERLIPENQT